MRYEVEAEQGFINGCTLVWRYESTEVRWTEFGIVLRGFEWSRRNGEGGSSSRDLFLPYARVIHVLSDGAA